MKSEKLYDYVIVGSGLYGACFAHLMNKNGKRCLVIDKRKHIGGNIYCENKEGINIHKYGPHIFHTKHKHVWEFVNSFAEFNHFVYSPLANYKGKLYNLPFNMNTFYRLWEVRSPKEARERIIKETARYINIEPKNLEEQALKLVGKDFYEIFIKGYTEKQWGRDAKNLPAFIIQRVPLRFTFNNNYFNDPFQGIPIGSYNKLIEGLLENIEVKTNTDFFKNIEYFDSVAEKILFTGCIDEFYHYRHGRLEYRSLEFETETLSETNYQGNAAVNYTEKEIPYTRIIEHKHFEFGGQPNTVITKEYPAGYTGQNEPFYPVNDVKNNNLYAKYKEMAALQSKYIFGGRLGDYQYYNMDDTILAALDKVLVELKETNYVHSAS